jgi:uncharacterized coiled-coil DUF342 family protein
MQHLDRDLAMGWLIRQDAPQAKEIRDYIDRLRVLARERDGLVEQYEALKRNRDYEREIARKNADTAERFREQLEAMRQTLDFFVNQSEIVEPMDYEAARTRWFPEASSSARER